MAKLFKSGKWKKQIAMGLSLSMAAVLSLGIFSACKTTDDEQKEEEESAAMPADTQLLKNGNFEFYSEMTKEEKELRAVLNTPTSWSFSSGSPSSDTKSGLVDLKYWETITGSKHEFSDISDAYTNWDEGSIYDKLNFFYKCNNPNNNEDYKTFEDAYDALTSDTAEKKFFNEHAFSSVDFEDVQYLKEELGESLALHGDTADEKQEERGILMIHNRRTSDGAVGTAQSYSSSTTITLKAGTAAAISVWVKTAQLRHYYSDLKGPGDTLDGLEVTSEAGAYISVTQTVGGTTLDAMQIKNINTAVTNPDGDTQTNNGWEQYTVYVRASTFATTTVRLVLGLGQGNSDDRYEAVNGYALFDDAEVKLINNAAYEEAVKNLDDYTCSLDSKKEDKLFDATKLNKDEDFKAKKTFAIDLYADFNPFTVNVPEQNFGLTEEKSGNSTYTSARIDKSLDDNRNAEDASIRSITAFKSLSDLKGEKTNKYLMNIYEKDFANYPFKNENNILLLLSTNGAAYTAKTTEFTLEKDGRMLISFFVKTNEVISGRSGASISLVDGENKTTISAFDSTKLDTVDIDDTNKDIYDGWAQCFFFVSNETDDAKTFTLEFSVGPTSIVSSNKYAYGQGYAAFANFQTTTLSKTELSYASTNDRAKKVSLKGIVEDTTFFDEADHVNNIEEGLATPVNFKGVLAGSKMVPPTDGSEATKNEVPEGVKTGLLNYKYADKYSALLGGNSWEQLFKDTTGKTALQPLVIMNTTGEDKPSYGYFATNTTISASSYQKISLRVKLSAKAKATVYLTDTSEFGSYNSFLAPNAPKVTYWYDEDGNICKSDPTAKDFKKNTGLAFELQKNGLYLKADSNDTTYYANLQNYKEKDGNLVTGNDTIAYYGHDGKYYAYRTEKADGTYSYDTVVKDLFDNGGKEIARYNYTTTEFPESVITVDNTAGTTPTDWITVTFYVHTGSEAKNYRLEVWAGDRYTADTAKGGIPANGYVFFDRYTATSISNYDTLLKEAVADLEDEADKVENDKLKEDYAYYYTFTFYDSLNYLRYDVNEDEDGVGNLYESYDQSTYSEEIIYLKYDDEKGDRTGSPAYIRFINYATVDTTVEPDTPATDNGSDSDHNHKEPISTGNILLIVSSSLLGVVIILVIVLLIVRKLADKRRRTTRTAPVRDLRYRPTQKKKPEPQPEAEEAEEEENPFVKNRKAKEAAEQEKAEEATEEAEPVEPAPEETPAEEPTEEPAPEAPAEDTEPAEEPAPTDDGTEE